MHSLYLTERSIRSKSSKAGIKKYLVAGSIAALVAFPVVFSQIAVAADTEGSQPVGAGTEAAQMDNRTQMGMGMGGNQMPTDQMHQNQMRDQMSGNQMQSDQMRQNQMQADQRQNRMGDQPIGSYKATQAEIQQGYLPLVGREVRNMNYDTIGEIQNVIADLDGNMTKAVVSVGGFMGIGADEVLVPVEKLNLTEKRRYVFFNGTEEELESYPEYEGYNWIADRGRYRNDTIMSPRYYRTGDTLRQAYSRQDYDSQAYSGPGDSYYDQAPRSSIGEPARMGQDDRYRVTERERRQQQFDANWSNTSENQFTASDLVGKNVQNTNNESIGEIDDVILSRQGRVILVMSVGDYIGEEGKKVRADLQDVTVRQDSVIYDISQQELKNDPAYQLDNRQSRATPNTGRLQTPQN